MLDALKSVPGVRQPRVEFRGGWAARAFVVVPDDLDPVVVINALKKIGFGARVLGG